MFDSRRARSYTALLTFCGEAKDPDKAFDIVGRMRAGGGGVQWNSVGWNSVVVACAGGSDMEHAFHVSTSMLRERAALDIVTGSNFLEACCKAAQLNRSPRR